MKDQSLQRRGLRRFRCTVRELMIVVFVAAAGFGWLVHLVRQARIPRDVVAVMRKLKRSTSHELRSVTLGLLTTMD